MAVTSSIKLRLGLWEQSVSSGAEKKLIRAGGNFK